MSFQLDQCTNYATYYFDSGSPTGFYGEDDATPVAAGVLAPGQGALYFNNQGGDEVVVFSGAPHNPALPAVVLPCGFGQTNLLGRPTKGPGTYENVTGYYEQEGAMVQKWNGFSYDNYFFTGGALRFAQRTDARGWGGCLFHCAAFEPAGSQLHHQPANRL